MVLPTTFDRIPEIAGTCELSVICLATALGRSCGAESRNGSEEKT